MWIFEGTRSQADAGKVTKAPNPNVSRGLAWHGLISGCAIWHYEKQSERRAMRIAASPTTLRIAAGLLLAVLLSVVGYQVVRRLNSHGPEARLKRAEKLLRENIRTYGEDSGRQAKLQFIRSHRLSMAISTRVILLPVPIVISNSIPDLHLDQMLSRILESDRFDGIIRRVQPASTV
jgi:hypothetical protein